MGAVRQFGEDGTKLYVGETSADRVTRWNATSGAYLGQVATVWSPLSVQLCRSGTGGTDIITAEFVTDEIG